MTRIQSPESRLWLQKVLLNIKMKVVRRIIEEEMKAKNNLHLFPDYAAYISQLLK
jgi:hypothetical protein